MMDYFKLKLFFSWLERHKLLSDYLYDNEKTIINAYLHLSNTLHYDISYKLF